MEEVFVAGVASSKKLGFKHFYLHTKFRIVTKLMTVKVAPL